MLSENFRRLLLSDRFFGRLALELINRLDQLSWADAQQQTVSGNTTLEATDSGKRFIATAAADFTLPYAAEGLEFTVAMTADANLGFAAPHSNDTLIHKGDAAADLVRCSTANQKIGSCLKAVAVEVSADTWKWLILNLGGTTTTVT